MTPAARIQATLELLQQIADMPRPADAIVSAYFRARRFIGSKDRGAIATRLYAVLRHQARLDWWIEKFFPASRTEQSAPEKEAAIKPLSARLRGERGNKGAAARAVENGVRWVVRQEPTSPHTDLLSGTIARSPLPPKTGGEGFIRLRLFAFLALVEKITVKNIDELCSGGKYAAASLSDEERAFLHKIEGSTIEHPDMPEEVIAECPPESYVALKKKFGKNFMREMRAMQEPATLDLRINPLKTTREEILAALDQMGFKAEACKLSPWGVRVFERPSLNALPILKNGLVEIQDEGSQMVALVVDARPGERIVDFCAGAGGKTLAIAACMQNKGRIVACDIREGRLKRSSERFRRAGLHNIEVKILSSERDPWVKKHKAGFDRVLVDAPCSGAGTWRRNPDARWRSLGPGMDKLLHTQAEILDSAARLVKPGGRLIYATCSLLPEENEDQIDKFLTAHPDFILSAYGLNNADYLSLTPAQHGTDGFFAAVMVRAEKPAKPAPQPIE